MMSQLAEINSGMVLDQVGARSTQQSLRILVIAAGVGTSILFIVVGLAADLQIFGDGSIFAYSVAAQDAWAFHWHNISGRLFGYVYSYIPAETYVALTKDPKGGIAIYGLLRFSAQLLGLVVTLAADRSNGRTIFVYACLSTACLCPLAFGAPTEMMLTHALFWPALAICYSAPASARGAIASFTGLLLLVFTHEGAVILSLVVLFAVFLRNGRGTAFMLAVAAWFAAMTIWFIVKLTIRPDDYIAGVLIAAAFKFIDIRNLAQPVVLLLLAALAGYGIAASLLRRLSPARAHVYAALGCAIALAIYWIFFDNSLLTAARYNLRTALLIGTPALGILATLLAMPESGFQFLSQKVAAAEKALDPRVIAGAILLTMLVHAVETSKFVFAWVDYKAAVRALANGADSDPALGDPSFVSSRRINAGLSRLAWDSTTPYLSVLVADGMRPNRLVVDPGANYFWLSCQTATASEQISTALPVETLRLIRRHACLHRPNDGTKSKIAR